MSNNVLEIRKWGNSQGVILSKKLLSQIGIDDPVNQSVSVEIKKGGLILKKKDETSRLMQEFGYLIGQRPEKEQRELDWGKDVGKEKF